MEPSHAFISKTACKIEMIDKGVLRKCYTGLKKRMKRTVNNAEKYRLRIICDEIRFLMNNL